MLRRALHLTYRTARRIVVTLVGVTVILIGVALIFLPGPATLVIPLGIAILGIEFAWARRWLRKIREKVGQAAGQFKKRGEGQRPPTEPGGRVP